MSVIRQQHQFLVTKNQCHMYKLTSVLVKIDVDVKIYELVFFKKIDVVIFMLTLVLENRC